MSDVRPDVPDGSVVVVQLRAIGELDVLLATAGLACWLFGGWAVDLHAGRVTRDHADIDVAVWADDLGRVGPLLEADGWSHRPDPDEDGWTTYVRDGVQLDALAACSPCGSYPDARVRS